MNKKEIPEFAVYEHGPKCSEEYIGTRFFTSFSGFDEKEDSKFIVVGYANTVEDAQALVRNGSGNRARAFLSTIPDEIKTPEISAFITRMIND